MYHANVNKVSYNSNPNVCSPIKNTNELWSCLQSPPTWIYRIIERHPRSSFVIKNVKNDCHVSEEHKILPKLRLDQNCVPKTLVCHDMKNGYLEDKYINSVNIGNGYSFYRWSQIDIFVYFSHHFITIPPVAWINVAHRNGVKICGTLITEWNEGKNICSQIFKDIETMKGFANNLVDISKIFKLDGWLLNFENTLDIQYVRVLMDFVKYFTQQIHNKINGSVVIWYDSLLCDGTLVWQNELNFNNKYFFDACDGIFLNYTWKEENLVNSAQFAGHRILDVYVGVDVFGRNFYAGGKYNTQKAMELIRKHNLSAAIFAPGWTHETMDLSPDENRFDTFIDRDNAFWKTIWPYLYTHPINNPFKTIFHVGVDKDWYKLNEQDVQLTNCLYPANEKAEFCLNETCDCLKTLVQDNYVSCLLNLPEKSNFCMHNLFDCDFSIYTKSIVYTQTKRIGSKCTDKLNLVLLIQNVHTGSIKKILCQCDEVLKKQNNVSVVEVASTNDTRIIELVNNIVSGKEDWTLRCYLIDFRKYRLLQVGAVIGRGASVCLCGFGIVYDPIIEVMQMN